MTKTGKKSEDAIAQKKSCLLGFAVQSKRSDGSIRVSFRWGRIVALLLVLAISGWFVSAGILYALLHKQGFETVMFTDTLLFRRDVLRQKMGDDNIQESVSHIQAGDYGDAFRLLHIGVARSPGNLEGRKLIAEFYESAMKRPSIAADYLLIGLEHGGVKDITYVKVLLQFLLRNQMDKKVQEIAETYLPEEPNLTDINRTLALGAASAHYQRGNYDQANDYLIAYDLIKSVDGLLISSQISWERGNRIAAITKLERKLNRFPNSEPLLILLSRYYRTMGTIDKARRYALLRSVKDPSSPKPKLELLYIYNQSGDHEREAQGIERMFEQFSDDKAALLEFANFAAQTGNTDLAKRIHTVAMENEFDLDLFAILWLESHLISKDYTGALDYSESLIEAQPHWLTEKWSLFNGLRSVAAYATKRPDLGEVYLKNFTEDTNHNAQVYLSIANHFSRIGQISKARKVLESAYRQIPANQRILSEFIKVELELGHTKNLDELLTRLLKMRRPPMELLVKAYQKLGSDRFIFTQNRETLLFQIGDLLRENNQSLLDRTATQ